MIIGITGGIGSGKTTIARELARQGFAVYDCDREAKRIIVEKEQVRKAIIELLGEEAFTPSPLHPFTGVYNTAYVAKRVFEDPPLLTQLNHIVHPEVAKDIIKQSAISVLPSNVLFVESAILFEAGLDALCNKIVVVDAPEDIRIARTIERDYQGTATEENIQKVRARIHAQSGYSPQTTIPILHLSNDGNATITDLVSIITHWM